MSIIVGDATDGVRTGLAGRIANRLAALFATVRYSANSRDTLTLNAIAQGVVDALNNDKINVSQCDSSIAGGSGGSGGYTPPPGGDASYYDFLLDNEPDHAAANYSVAYTGNLVTNETWTDTGTGLHLKTVDYSYTSNLLTSEVRKVYASDGITIVAETTITYGYTGGQITSSTNVRNV